MAVSSGFGTLGCCGTHWVVVRLPPTRSTGRRGGCPFSGTRPRYTGAAMREKIAVTGRAACLLSGRQCGKPDAGSGQVLDRCRPKCGRSLPSGIGSRLIPFSRGETRYAKTSFGALVWALSFGEDF
jgi:hypothetical protein